MGQVELIFNSFASLYTPHTNYLSQLEIVNVLGFMAEQLFNVTGWQSTSGHLALWDGKNFREIDHDDYRKQQDDPLTTVNEGTTTGMTLWTF